MKRFILSMTMGAAMLIASAPKAEAAVILVFGQTGTTNTITGTANVGGTQTTINGTNVGVFITAIEGGAPTAAFLTLNATSDSPATSQITPGGEVVIRQDFNGSFCITSAVNCGGTNYLSGTFEDFTAGLEGGGALVMAAAQPPATVTFTSSVITSLDLARAMALSFTNVTPFVHIQGSTLGSFTASVSGNFSANIGQQIVPEPGSMLLLGTGLLGLAAAARRRMAKKS